MPHGGINTINGVRLQLFSGGSVEVRPKLAHGIGE
jgi:hypothetical protein